MTVRCIDTINPPGREERLAAVLGSRLEAAGFAVASHEPAPGRISLVARLPGRGDAPALCLTAHLDTVPLGGARWDHDPFSGEIDGDRLYGRGASDMKGGLAAIVVAAERLAREGQLARGWRSCCAPARRRAARERSRSFAPRRSAASARCSSPRTPPPSRRRTAGPRQSCAGLGTRTRRTDESGSVTRLAAAAEGFYEIARGWCEPR